MPSDLSVPTVAMFELDPIIPKEEPFMQDDTPGGGGGGTSVPDVLGELEFDFMEWDGTSAPEGLKVEEGEKGVGVGFWEQKDVVSSLNLRLNHQEVLDAWSDRGPPWVDPCSWSVNRETAPHYAEEVPNMEMGEEERERRRARVLKYREKRHCRLFSKKIRYEVRKLNAEKRPRLKGRFAKGSPDKMTVR